MKLAYIVVAYGEDNYTNTILADLAAQPVSTDIYLVDNKGDYDSSAVEEAFRASKSTLQVLEGEQRRWLKGTNYGTGIAHIVGENYGEYSAYVWMNNDTRISPHFSEGMMDALEALGDLCGILAPSYDDVWPQQHCGYTGPAEGYEPLEIEEEVKFVDGACMAVTNKCWTRLGGMDERFWQYGWGGDLDYCLRARQSGFGVWVTQRAYFNHFGGGTNKMLEENYHGDAGSEMHSGMLEKYGSDWSDLIS